MRAFQRFKNNENRFIIAIVTMCTRIFDSWITCARVCEDFRLTHLFISLSASASFNSSTIARSSWKIFSILIYVAVLDREDKSLDTRKREECVRNSRDNRSILTLHLSSSSSSFSSLSFDDSSHLHESLFLLSTNNLLRSIISFNIRTTWTTLTEITMYHSSLNVLSKTSSHWRDHCEINSWRFAKLFNMMLLNKIESDWKSRLTIISKLSIVSSEHDIKAFEDICWRFCKKTLFDIRNRHTFKHFTTTTMRALKQIFDLTLKTFDRYLNLKQRRRITSSIECF